MRIVERERSAEDRDTVRDWSAEDQETARVAVLAAEVHPDAGAALVVLVVAASSSFNECTIDTANMTTDFTGSAALISLRKAAGVGLARRLDSQQTLRKFFRFAEWSIHGSSYLDRRSLVRSCEHPG
jgi:hypothetical protein